MLDDEVLATTLLDRLFYHCEVINLSGKSFRVKNQTTIFNKNEEK
jgi:DNA replication protein DnaC